MEYKQINEIIARKSLDKTIGRILGHVCEGDNRIQLIGYPTKHPHFINSIDKELWIKGWEKKSDDLEIRFNNVSFAIDGLNEVEIVDCSSKIAKVLTRYHTATQNYNERIAEPFIKQRKSALIGYIPSFR